MAEQRVRVIYIVALPGFYGLMCFLCSMQTIELALDTVGEHWALPSQDAEVKVAFSKAMGQLQT